MNRHCIIFAILSFCFSQCRAEESPDFRSVTADSYKGCPAPLNRLAYSIKSEVTHLPNSDMYEYHYNVNLAPTSPQKLNNFWFQANDAIPGTYPQGWICNDLNSNIWKYIRIGCSNVQAAPPPVGEKDDGNIPPSLHPVNPGSSAEFVIKSRYAPGPVMVYIEGEGRLPESDKMTANSCPADSLGSFTDMAILDSMSGPLDGKSLNLKLLSHAKNNVIDMNNPRISIGILQTPEVALSSIDPASIRLGAEGSLTVIGSVRELQSDNAEPMLTMDFELETTGIHCQDKAVFLTAKSKAGERLQGSVPITIQNCKMKFQPVEGC